MEKWQTMLLLQKDATVDAFGNLICFDKTNDKIVFIDHETHSAEEAANTFTKFIKNLMLLHY